MPRPTALLFAALGAAMSVSVGMAGPASATTTLAAPAGTYDALNAGGAHPTADGTGCVLPVEWFHISPDQVESYYLQVGLAEPKAPSGTKDPGIPVTARSYEFTIPRTQTDFRVWIVAKGKDGTYSHWGSWGVAWFGSAC